MPLLIDTIDDATARAACARHDHRPDALIEILHDIQAHAGHVSDGAISTTAQALNLSRAEVLGVVSFYHDFRRQPGARHTLQLCRAAACQAAGGEAVAAQLADALDDAGSVIELRETYCLGNCALAPAARLDDQPLGRIDAGRVLAELSARGIRPEAGE